MNPGPSTLLTQMPVNYNMQTVQVPSSSSGQPAQLMANVSPVPHANYSKQATRMEVSYLQPEPREQLAPEVPLLPVRSTGMFWTCLYIMPHSIYLLNNLVVL